MNSTTINEMSINLLETESQNMNISFELFDIVKQNAEEYCAYISKYKECTASYYDKLSKLTFNIKKDNITSNKNLNTSSIFSILYKIPELVKLQIQGLKKFVDSLDLTIKPLENVLKTEINSLEKYKYNFEESKKLYQKNTWKHKKLMDTLSLTEKKIIKYYLSKKKLKNYVEEKNSMIASLRDAKILEKDFLEGINGEENYHWLFQENCLKNISEIKSHIRTLLENLNSCILFFLCVFNDSYSPCVNFIQNETKVIKSDPINTKNLINENMFLTIYKLEELPNDKYTVKIFNKPEINKLSYSIDLTNNATPKNTNILSFFIRDNDDVSEDEIFSNLNKIDLLGMAKKLYHNFKMINKGNYDIKSEEERINVKNYSDKIILMKKFKNSSKKIEKITYEEKKNFFQLVQKKENGEIFLTRLNKIRSYGIFEYPKKVFDDILKVFLIKLNELLINKEPFLFQFAIILSQTFYYMENGQKQYLYIFMKNHKVFHKEEMWRNLLDFIINEKIDKFNEIEFKIQTNNDDEEKKKRKMIDIIFAQLIAMTHNMTDFDFDIDKTEKIMIEYINKYNLDETYKQIIMDMIQNKKNENSTPK